MFLRETLQMERGRWPTSWLTYACTSQSRSAQAAARENDVLWYKRNRLIAAQQMKDTYLLSTRCINLLKKTYSKKTVLRHDLGRPSMPAR